MPIAPLFGLGQTGKSPAVTAQRHLNLYAELIGDPDKAQVVFYGTPGVTLFTTFGDTPVRGAIAIGNLMYMVHRGVLWEVNNAGVKTNRGTLATTSGRVSMAYNGTQIAIVDGASMYLYTVASNSFAVVTSGLFANPTDVTYQDSYFIAIFANSGRFQISGQYDGSTWSALDFSNAESNPDSNVRILADHGEIVICGELSSEFWGNSGGLDFPYSNVRGATLEFGLAAPWSLVKFNDSLAGLFKNRMGQVQIMQMQGHALQKISTPELDYLINSYATVADATAFSYMLGGHPMYQISFPSAGKSWLYDGSTGLWSSLESSGGRHLAEIHLDFLNKPKVTDYANGNIYTLDPAVYTDNGAPIAREIVTKHIFRNDDKFSISRVQVDFESGQGLSSGQGVDPQAMLQISRDNGHTWGNERWASMGAQGNYKARTIWRRCGAAYDALLKFRITDPVKVVITNIRVD